jgi:L-threonylcarbamoyladenylate synthase
VTLGLRATQLDEAVNAIRSGELAVIPTDTVYGLACTPYREEPVRRLSEVKGRAPEQPIALVATDVDWLLECVPELRGRAALLARALLPGPVTLVLPNPARRFRWLTGTRPDKLGVRVPDALGVARALLDKVGAVAATSANLHGRPDPARLADVPPEIRSRAVVLDAGELPGTPSTVIDLTGDEPEILREGALPAGEALARVTAALAQ